MRYFLTFLTVLSFYHTDAQLKGQALIDSLQVQLAHMTDDSVKFELLDDLAYFSRTIAPDKGVRYGEQELELAIRMGSQKRTAKAYCQIGVNYRYLADYPRAMGYLLKALKINEEIGHLYNQAVCLNNIGVVYQNQGDLKKAIECFQRSLKINEQLKNKANMAGDMGNIGILYLTLGDQARALEYDLRSLAIFREIGDKDGIGHNLGNIGNIYQQQGNYTQALEYDLEALKIFEELGDKNSIAINLGNIGETYFAVAKDKKAHSAAAVSDLANAITYLKKSVDVCKEIGDLESLIEFSNYLSEAYLAAGDHAQALESYKLYATMSDSVHSIDSKVQIAKLETQRELDIKDKQIQIEQLEVAKRRNERILLMIVVVLLLVLFGIVLRKFNDQRRSNKELATEKKRHLARIEAQKNVLSDIAYTQSHEVSGQVATILGLVQVFNTQDYSDPDNKQVIDGIAEVATKLDGIVKEMIIKENTFNK